MSERLDCFRAYLGAPPLPSSLLGYKLTKGSFVLCNKLTTLI